MRLSIVGTRSFRFAAALVVSTAAATFAPGCDQASQPGTVEIGGKDGRNKVTPGAPAPAPGGEAPKKVGTGAPGESGRSIKERPGG